MTKTIKTVKTKALYICDNKKGKTMKTNFKRSIVKDLIKLGIDNGYSIEHLLFKRLGEINNVKLIIEYNYYWQHIMTQEQRDEMPNPAAVERILL